METYQTSGVCSKEIQFEIEDNKIKSVNFIGGCPGNFIQKLKGIPCRTKETSCPDQLAKALERYLEQK